MRFLSILNSQFTINSLFFNRILFDQRICITDLSFQIFGMSVHLIEFADEIGWAVCHRRSIFFEELLIQSDCFSDIAFLFRKHGSELILPVSQ